MTSVARAGRTDTVTMAPMLDPVDALVLQATPADVDTVVVDGIVRKRHGALTGVDLQAIAADALARGRRILDHAATVDPGWIEPFVAAAFPNTGPTPDA